MCVCVQAGTGGDRQAERQTNEQTDRQTDRQTDCIDLVPQPKRPRPDMEEEPDCSLHETKSDTHPPAINLHTPPDPDTGRLHKSVGLSSVVSHPVVSHEEGKARKPCLFVCNRGAPRGHWVHPFALTLQNPPLQVCTTDRFLFIPLDQISRKMSALGFGSLTSSRNNPEVTAKLFHGVLRTCPMESLARPDGSSAWYPICQTGGTDDQTCTESQFDAKCPKEVCVADLASGSRRR